MSVVVSMLTEVLDDLDEAYFSSTPELAKKIILIEKKLKKILDVLYKEEADAEILGVDGQSDSLDESEDVLE